MTKTDNLNEVGLHVFERAGLGKAPFHCIGMEEKTFQACQGAPIQPGGSCKYCGQGIRYVYIVRGRDGRCFGVGSDCVAKTGDAGLIRSYKTLPAVRAANRAKAKAKDDRVIAEWQTLINLPENIAKLSALFVPGRPWVPGEQVSLLDDMNRIWRMCGAAGRARNLKALKKYLAL